MLQVMLHRTSDDGRGKQVIDLKHSSFIFKGGEVQFKFTEFSSLKFMGAEIFASITSSDDLMELFLATDAVRRQYGNIPIDVTMPYVPYARQDRVCAPGEAFSIRVVADLINSQGYNLVKVWDPHSDVTTALINNCEVVKAYIFARKVLDSYPGPMDNLVLVSPDAGANKKIFEAANYLRINEVIRADKTRDVQTGALSGTEVYGDVRDKVCFILDDIGDGLGTFILLGKKLKEMGASKVILYITHGIFSRGVDIMEGAVDEIYCPNVWEENVKDRNTKGILRRTLG